jgi:type IV secretory pathway protease TraF
MNPYWTNLARRNRQAVAALLVCLGFAAAHAAAFQPTLARYRRNAQQAAELGMPLDATGAQPAASPRTTALLARNSLNTAVAEEQGTSGALTAGLLDEVTRLVAKSGLEVVATEQGLVTQLPSSVQVRAHLKLRGRYAAFVALLGELSRSGSLVAVDRFTLQAGAGGRQDIEVWMSQLILKRTPSAR